MFDTAINMMHNFGWFCAGEKTAFRCSIYKLKFIVSAIADSIDNIKGRAASYNGIAEFDSQPGNGCVLTVTFPVTHALLTRAET